MTDDEINQDLQELEKVLWRIIFGAENTAPFIVFYKNF